MLFLESGAGYNTHGIIKYPFWQKTAANPRAVYGESTCPDKVRVQSICKKAARALKEQADYVTSGADEDGMEGALKVFGLL